MDLQIIQKNLDQFESYKHTTDEGIEFWFARELQELLWYSKRENFVEVINKAKLSCKTNNLQVSDHFPDVGKMVTLWSWSQREINDYALTRYACYLIAQNGDPRKSQIAFAQSYFATQTRKLEIIQQNLAHFERIVARKKLSETETELSKVIFEQTNSDKNFAIIRSKWDTALFGRTTSEMKTKRWLKPSQPLADAMPTILLKAKDFASEITIYNAKHNNMTTENQISKEHITNNTSVRQTLIERWITPEEVKPEPDIKKLTKNLDSDTKKKLGKV